MRTLPPRAVIVTRPTDYTSLLLRHGTREQARFFLESRGQSIDEAWARHTQQEQALHDVTSAVPGHWRRALVTRADLNRFLFEPEDVVVAVGQDGLVANVAKYLTGQSVVGVNPAPGRYPGVLVKHPAQAAPDLLRAIERGSQTHEARAMVRAALDDGTALLALNEIYVGHTTHQSARYTLLVADKSERQSSSGLIVATGTGATGWAKSVATARNACPPLPTTTSSDLIFLVREAWPSPATGCELVHGLLSDGAAVTVRSEMNEGGCCFGDGIENDRLALGYGQTVTLARAPLALKLAA